MQAVLHAASTSPEEGVRGVASNEGADRPPGAFADRLS
jgi:hypothetical protein